MKPLMILVTAAAAAALTGAAAAGAVPTDDHTSASLNAPSLVHSSRKAPDRQSAGPQASARAKRLLHNPGLPPWIP